MTPEPEHVRVRPTGMTSPPRHLGSSLAVGALLVGLLMLTACASTDGRAGSPGPATPSSSPPSPVPTGSGEEEPMTLTGEVGPGVETGCTILTSGDQVYELQGTGVSSLSGTVTVKGHVLHGVLTICQQGTPFRVVEVTRS